jgi:putative membrane protein
MNIIKNLIKGFVIGIAFIIPGVSGGTLAVYLGVYQKMLDAISNIFKDFKNSVKFLFPIFLGIGLSVVLLAKIFSLLLDWNSFIILFFFIGLLLGGIKTIYNKCEMNKINVVKITAFILAFAFLILLVFLEKSNTGTGIAYFDFNFMTYVLLIALGMIGSMTMIVPGISGSAVLLVLGFYTAIVSNVIGNIFEFDDIVYNLQVIIPFALGALLGVIIFSKVISYLLKKFPQATYMAILGFILASVIGVFLEIKDPATATYFSDQLPVYENLLVYISDNIWSVAGGLISLAVGYIGSLYLTKFELGGSDHE